MRTTRFWNNLFFLYFRLLFQLKYCYGGRKTPIINTHLLDWKEQRSTLDANCIDYVCFYFILILIMSCFVIFWRITKLLINLFIIPYMQHIIFYIVWESGGYAMVKYSSPIIFLFFLWHDHQIATFYLHDILNVFVVLLFFA